MSRLLAHRAACQARAHAGIGWRTRVLWLLGTAGLTAWFGAWTAHNLANFRPVSNDEVELMQVGYQLATRGVLGSDMYAGFFGADTHHMWTLPVQHVLDAVSFRVFGGGVAQARWVSIVAAVAIVWVTGWLALRWYGLVAALSCEVLLIFWRSDLTPGATGIPLLDVARVARYDVLAVAFAWLGIAALDFRRRRFELLSGVLAGLAALSQFFGAFVLPVTLLSCRRKGRLALFGGLLVAVVPWLAYVASHLADLRGQLAVYGERGAFLQPGFYMRNLINEPSRYGQLAGDWLAILGIGSALAYLAVARDGRLGVTLLAFGGLLTLLDQTKTPLYAIALVPTICLALGAAWSRLVKVRVGTAVTLVFAALLVNSGMQAYTTDRVESGLVSSYLGVGQQLEAKVTPGGLLIGPERWWWALHDHPYISLRSLWFQWTPNTRFSDLANRWQPTEIVVNNNARDDLEAFPAPLQQQFWTFIAECATLVGEVNDATYFEMQVYRVGGC